MICLEDEKPLNYLTVFDLILKNEMLIIIKIICLMIVVL